MKEIVYKGRKFFYEKHHSDFDVYTVFYYGYEEVFKRRFLFFGKKIKTKVPRVVGRTYGSYDNPEISSQFWRGVLNNITSKLDREEEIKKGKLI